MERIFGAESAVPIHHQLSLGHYQEQNLSQALSLGHSQGGLVLGCAVAEAVGARGCVEQGCTWTPRESFAPRELKWTSSGRSVGISAGRDGAWVSCPACTICA
mmetsp:Transcript_66692/g.145426  ORF Transcript_66692/g.145426 Transcript_66692/m.145426 type:complete len:103 (+) Transcript_66692:171-479(+)